MDNKSSLNQSGIVPVVEDDQSLRSAIASALKVRGIDYLEFETRARSLLCSEGGSVTKPTCMLLDIRLGSGPSGLSVFDEDQ